MNKKSDKIGLLGAALALGSGRASQAQAPNYLRQLGLVQQLQQSGVNLTDFGDVGLLHQTDLQIGSTDLRYLSPMIAYQQKLYKQCSLAVQTSDSLLLIGGDHSVAFASTVARAQQQPNLGLLWIDAHADINTPFTTLSGNIHGMVISSLMGIGPLSAAQHLGTSYKLKSRQLVYFGLRDLDLGEEILLESLRIKAYFMQEIRERGLALCLEEAVMYMKTNTEAYHVSFDLDVCDPKEMPVVAVPVADGISLKEAGEILTVLGNDSQCMGFDFVELNPAQDFSTHSGQALIELIKLAYAVA